MSSRPYRPGSLIAQTSCKTCTQTRAIVNPRRVFPLSESTSSEILGLTGQHRRYDAEQACKPSCTAKIDLRAGASVPDHTLENDSVCDTLSFATSSFDSAFARICCKSEQVRFSALKRNMHAFDRERAGAAGNCRGSSCRSVRKRHRRLARGLPMVRHRHRAILKCDS